MLQKANAQRQQRYMVLKALENLRERLAEATRGPAHRQHTHVSVLYQNMAFVAYAYEIMTSEFAVVQPLCFMMAGRCVAHSVLYSTRATQRSNAE